MQLTITHMSGPRDSETLNIEAVGSPPTVTFGRHTECTISLPDDMEISRRHARLTWRGGSWWLEDLGSTNGTFVGEFSEQQKIPGTIVIATGTVFRVGLSRFRIGTLDVAKYGQVLKAEWTG